MVHFFAVIDCPHVFFTMNVQKWLFLLDDSMSATEVT